MTPQPTGDSAHEPPEAGDGTVLGSFHGLSAAPDAGLEQVGDEIGPYRILSQLGEGGFGTVFLAERREPFVQRVALKLVKPGMDSRAVIARFEQERQALAVMDHPGIARVLDGGLTPQGRPYFAMEYVKGDTITAYCDARRLSLRARLRLFEKACEAVQHAHLKGLIHRDIKPTNVLAFDSEGGEPDLKVIDFGVAKAVGQPMTEKTLFTELGQMIGTPEYMSPEQADPGLGDIDTRSDVFSLGVLLYELVAGATPFDGRALRSKGYGEIQRILQEDDPPSPSARVSTITTRDSDLSSRIARARGLEIGDLARELRSELEWIPLMAMRKEPQLRYQTALEFAADVRNYLEGRPLVAGPESPAYRAKKILRRHRGLVLGAAAVLAAILSGLALTTWQWREAVSERARAVVEAERADALAQDARARLEDLQRVSSFQAQMLRDLDVTLAGSALMADLRARHGDALESVALSDEERAARRDSFQLALSRVNATDVAAGMIDRNILERARAAVDSNFDRRPAVGAQLLIALGEVYSSIGLVEEALPLFQRARQTRAERLGPDHPNTLQVNANVTLGLLELNRLEEAEAILLDTLERRRRVSGPEHRETMVILAQLGSLRQRQGRYPEARDLLSEALTGLREATGDTSPQTMSALSNLGLLYSELGESDKADRLIREALAAREATLGSDHPDTLAGRSSLAFLLSERGENAEAEQIFRGLLDDLRAIHGEDHPDVRSALGNLAAIIGRSGRLEEAEPLFRESVMRTRRAMGDEHPDTILQEGNLATLVALLGNDAEALDMYRSVLAKLTRVMGEEHPLTIGFTDSAGALLRRMGRTEEARTYCVRALELRRATFGEEHPATLISVSHLGQLLVDAGSYDEAVELLEGVSEAMERAFEEGDRSRLGKWNFTLGCARAGLAKDPESRAEAERSLTAAYALLEETTGASGPDSLACAAALAELHAGWAEASPDGDHAAEAARWKDLARRQRP